ncbi:SxtJ family membrane protein [Fulvivirgaceae bacterium BMA10]|uniref:SxtJ family membrane protein n=1 Tax=Splendidivirga corallicola TaxID=3051826 RepID=A0ABT8KXG0_9BACT|nr:SxtJ family membrane protein [Fulvivirgaceae bacterium BMA10]
MTNNEPTKFGIFPTSISKQQTVDTGMAMILILLLIGFFTDQVIYYKICIPVLVLNMTVPKIYYPLAIVWFGLSNLLGMVMSRVLLSVVFSLVVVPIGALRKMMGKDSMQLKNWKKDSGSAMKTLNKTFTSRDLERPY